MESTPEQIETAREIIAEWQRDGEGWIDRELVELRDLIAAALSAAEAQGRAELEAEVGESKEATHQQFYAAFHAWFMQGGCDFWNECNAPEELATIAVEMSDIRVATALAAERAKHEAEIARLRYERDVLQWICASRASQIEGLRGIVDPLPGEPNHEATLTAARRAEGLEEAAQWHEDQRPQLSGPDYGLASLEERQEMRADYDFHTDCAAAIRSLIGRG